MQTMLSLDFGVLLVALFCLFGLIDCRRRLYLIEKHMLETQTHEELSRASALLAGNPGKESEPR